MSGPYLIVGLGNPGEKYAKTRHNLGFMALDAFAEKYGWRFKREWRLEGKVAVGIFEGKTIVLLKPATYMNLSGQSVKRCTAFYKSALQNLLVIVDDVNLPFESLRVRPEGSSGGHNGLKNIDFELKTQAYARLRLGVGNEDLPKMRLEEYVLANFSMQEDERLVPFLDKAVSVLECWIVQGTEKAMQYAGDLSKAD